MVGGPTYHFLQLLPSGSDRLVLEHLRDVGKGGAHVLAMLGLLRHLHGELCSQVEQAAAYYVWWRFLLPGVTMSNKNELKWRCGEGKTCLIRYGHSSPAIGAHQKGLVGVQTAWGVHLAL